MLVTWLWERRQWVLLVVLAIIGALWFRTCQRERELARQVDQRNSEAELHANHDLADAGVVVEDTVPPDVLQKKLDDLVKDNADLAAQLAAARAAAGKVKVVQVDHYITKEVLVHGDPIPGAPAACPPCLLDGASRAQLELDGIDLITDKGVQLHLLSISAWRTYPTRTKLFDDGIAVPASSSSGVGAGITPAPREKSLFLSLSVDWDPANLQLRPEWTAEASYTKWRLWGVELGAFAEIGRWYTGRGDAQDWNVRVGPRLELGVW